MQGQDAKEEEAEAESGGEVERVTGNVPDKVAAMDEDVIKTVDVVVVGIRVFDMLVATMYAPSRTKRYLFSKSIGAKIQDRLL